MIVALLALAAHAEQPFQSSWPATDADKLWVHVVGGDVTVEARDGADTVSLAVSRDHWTEGCKLETALDGRTVKVEVTRPSGKLGEPCRVTVDVTVPAAIAVDLATSQGDLAVGGVAGDATLDVGFGDIRLTDLGGAVAIDLGTGDIVGSVTGRSLTAVVGKGQLRVTGLVGPATASVGVGKLDLTWSTPPAGDTRLTVKAGTLIARYPEGTSLAADLDAAVGSVANDFDDDPGSANRLYARVTAGSVRVLTR